MLKFKMKFNIERTERGYLLSAMNENALDGLRFNIQVSDSVTKSCKLAIHHVKRIYDCFEELEPLSQLRSSMMLLRLWR